jgi:hypothetical protein
MLKVKKRELEQLKEKVKEHENIKIEMHNIKESLAKTVYRYQQIIREDNKDRIQSTK